MNVLVTLLCTILALTIFAGSYYMAKVVVTKDHRISILEDEYRRATEHIATQEETILQLNQALDYTQHEATLKSQRVEQPRSWNPKDMLNSKER